MLIVKLNFSKNRQTLDPTWFIVKNTRLLLSRIAKELPEESQKLRLTQFLLQRCYLVLVHNPDFDSAYKIFSVLNDRGLDLSIIDILKADVIGKLSQSKEEEKYTRKWENLEELLGRKDFSELFSYIWTQEIVKAKQGYLLAELK